MTYYQEYKIITLRGTISLDPSDLQREALDGVEKKLTELSKEEFNLQHTAVIPGGLLLICTRVAYQDPNAGEW